MILLLLACMPDDVDDTGKSDTDTAVTDTSTTDTTDTSDTSTTPDGLAGKWLSEGDDLSDLFAPYYTSLDANFKTSMEYVVSSHDADGGNQRYEGTYTIDESTSPASIVLTQSIPYDAVASGIFEVDGDTLTYEVVQTTPDYGYVPPTPESGFGTTSGPDIEPGVNIQIYRRTE